LRRCSLNSRSRTRRSTRNADTTPTLDFVHRIGAVLVCCAMLHSL
jgi:hypothetical protein